jgi:uncharacterized protein (TIGR02266 family)
MGEKPPVREVDTREHPRYDVSIPVDCSTRQSYFSNQARNISKGGLFLQSATPLPLDAEISLVLHLPGAKRNIFATGRVIWSGDTGKGTTPIGSGSGIRFVGMTASDRAALESYLAGLTPARTRMATRR